MSLFVGDKIQLLYILQHSDESFSRDFSMTYAVLDSSITVVSHHFQFPSVSNLFDHSV